MRNEGRFDETKQQTMQERGMGETKTFYAMSWRRKSFERQTMTSFTDEKVRRWRLSMPSTNPVLCVLECFLKASSSRMLFKRELLESDTVFMHFVTFAKSRADEKCSEHHFYAPPLASVVALIIWKENGFKRCLLSDKKNEMRLKLSILPVCVEISAPISQTCENNSFSW